MRRRPSTATSPRGGNRQWTDPQWLQIDLGAATALRRVVINWETAHGKVYDVLASQDGKARLADRRHG